MPSPKRLLLTAALLLTGCSAFGQPYHEKDLYSLNLADLPATMPATQSAADADAPVACPGMARPMRVRPLRVASPFNGESLVYKTRKGTYSTDYYRAFIAPPDRLLTTGLVEYLSSHGSVYSLAPASIADAPYDLESHCTLLLGDYSGPSPIARVAFRFQLVKIDGPRITPVWSKAYTREIPFEEGDAQKLIDALSQGVREIFAQLSLDLDKTGEFPAK